MNNPYKKAARNVVFHIGSGGLVCISKKSQYNFQVTKYVGSIGV